MRNILSQTCVGSKEHFSSEYFGAEKKIRWSSGYAETSVETPEMYGLTQLGQHSKDKDERGERESMMYSTQHTRQRDNNIQTLVQTADYECFFWSFLSYISGFSLNHNITLFLIKTYNNLGQMLWSLIWQNSYFTPLTKQFVKLGEEHDEILNQMGLVFHS